MAVALYGDTAFLALMPRFAKDGGLFDRRTTKDEMGDVKMLPATITGADLAA